MPKTCGNEAVVIGAGMGGLAAAKALSSHFEHVTVLDRDSLPSGPEPRMGTPQARHGHALLLSGQQALEQLFPGFGQTLEDAGAVRIRAGVDIIWERPGYDPFPIRDLGFDSFWRSRALLEYVCRRMLTAVDNVSLLANSRVTEIVASDRQVVTAVRHEDENGGTSTLSADFVVDASGRGGPTLTLLQALELPQPETTEIGVDVAYSSVIFEAPKPEPGRWRGVFHLGHARTPAAAGPFSRWRAIVGSSAWGDVTTRLPPATSRALWPSSRGCARRLSTMRFATPGALARSSVSISPPACGAISSGC